MFKWPDPPEGQVVIKLPFTIYWAVSGSITAVIFLASAPLMIRLLSEGWNRRLQGTGTEKGKQ